MWLFSLLFSSLSQLWYVEVRISRSVSVSSLEFEITRVDCILINHKISLLCFTDKQVTPYADRNKYIIFELHCIKNEVSITSTSFKQQVVLFLFSMRFRLQLVCVWMSITAYMLFYHCLSSSLPLSSIGKALLCDCDHSGLTLYILV